MRVRCQKKSVVYETECIRVATQRGTSYSFETDKATLYLIRSEMVSQCSFSRRGVEWW